MDHPVAGLVRHGDVVWLFVHENVPGVVEKTKALSDLPGPAPHAVPRSQIVRYDIPAAALLRWTRESLAGLRAESVSSTHGASI